MDEAFFKKKDIGRAIFIAPNATVVGHVVLKEETSIWFGAVLRGDSDKISIGARTNIQDNAVLHCDPGDPCIIGEGCVIGHGAIIHGATIGNDVLIGMNSTVLNNAIIGDGSIVGANALIPQGMIVPPNSLVLGVPAKVIKQIDAKESIRENTLEYIEKSKVFAKNKACLLD